MLLITRIISIFILNALLIDCQLYSKEDNVTIFQPQSFNKTFFDKPAENWFVQFYHSYCGHCINFAPKFKQFLGESKHWSDVIRFGVIDCSQYKDTCNSQGVNYYPFFKMYTKKGSNESDAMGLKITVPHNNIDELYMGVIQNIELFLKPSNLIETRVETNVTEKQYLLLIGSDNVNLKRTILTFTGRLVYPLHFRLNNTKLDYDVIFVNGTSSASHSVSDMVELYLWLSQYRNQKAETRIYRPSDKITEPPIFIPNKNMSVINAAVYNQDIYSSIFYSFTNDISDSLLTNIDDVIILRNFVDKLYLYSDISEQFTANFKALKDLLDKKVNGMRSHSKIFMRWSDMLRHAKFPDMPLSWVGCNGSLPHLRRYPCGLWTMFHTLTVNHHIKVSSKQIATDDSVGLMSSIREFIFTFFACRECADNFKKETAAFETRASSSSRAVIYLWQVHNSVNHRLSGAPSDDPQHLKAAFPSEAVCPSCRLGRSLLWPKLSQWSFPDVLRFLVVHYSSLNRVQFLTPPALLLLTASVSSTSTWFLVGPSGLDVAICVCLSLFCLLVVVLVFVRFWLKSSLCSLRRYRRAPLLG